MTRFALLSGILLLSALVRPPFSMATDFSYSFPQSVALSLTPSEGSKVTSEGKFELNGTVEPRVGTLTDLKVFFETSPDLVVNPAGEEISELGTGKKKDYLLSVSPGPGKSDGSGTWVRLRLVYFPDYRVLEQEFSDTTKYPYEPERKRMLEIVEKNMAEIATQTDAVFFRVKP